MGVMDTVDDTLGSLAHGPRRWQHEGVKGENMTVDVTLVLLLEEQALVEERVWV